MSSRRWEDVEEPRPERVELFEVFTPDGTKVTLIEEGGLTLVLERDHPVHQDVQGVDLTPELQARLLDAILTDFNRRHYNTSPLARSIDTVVRYLMSDLFDPMKDPDPPEEPF